MNKKNEPNILQTLDIHLLTNVINESIYLISICNNDGNQIGKHDSLYVEK